VALADRHVVGGEVALRAPALAAVEAVADAGHVEDARDGAGGAHQKPAGLRPGEWAHSTLNKVPICSGAVRRSTARAMLPASAGLARARALARSPRPRRNSHSP